MITARKNLWALLVLLPALALTLSACASAFKAAPDLMKAEQLQTFALKALDNQELKLFKVPYEISPEIAAIARGADNPGLSKWERARELALSLIKEDKLGISYSHNRNLTALEVFEERKANCISYTNLYIGMARAIGIDARYAEVFEVDSFDKVGDTVIYNSHICAVIVDTIDAYLVDFSLRPNKQYRSWRVVGDLEATAIFYNNIGAQHYLDQQEPGNIASAQRFYNIALKLYPDNPQVHNNYGVLEMHRLNTLAAERHFRQERRHRERPETVQGSRQGVPGQQVRLCDPRRPPGAAP